MTRMLVTCPESAHLEEIEIEAHPLGSLILSCSAFCPATEVTCPGTCAARMDRKRLAARKDPDALIGTTLLLRSCFRTPGS